MAADMARTHDHEIVSIYPFSDEDLERLLSHSNECVLMWATKDGWPVGVTHAFVWHEGKLWLTFAAHRHRAAAIRRDPRVSVNVSSAGYPPGSPDSLPRGAVTLKGRAAFFDDDETKDWFYRALSRKLFPNSDAIRSTATTAVRLRTSSAGLSSTMSSEPRRPVSATISMQSCASR